MKVPLEILIVVILIYVGWGQPFKEQADRISGKPQAKATPRLTAGPRPEAVPTPRPSNFFPPRDNSWMRRPGTLDRH